MEPKPVGSPDFWESQATPLAGSRLNPLGRADHTGPSRQRDEIGGELLFVFLAPRRFALGRAVLPERPAGATLGDVQHGPDVLHTGAPTRGAQKFPRAASCRISLSSVRSAIALRSRWFSVSRSFMRRTWSLFRPPYSLRQR